MEHWLIYAVILGGAVTAALFVLGYSTAGLVAAIATSAVAMMYGIRTQSGDV